MNVTSHQRHNQAMLAPSRKDEKAIVNLLRGLEDFRELLQADDGQRPNTAALQGMSDIARGLHKLIQQAPLGRLDRGLIEAALAPFVLDPPTGTLSLVQDQEELPAESMEPTAAESTHTRLRRSALPA